MTIAEVSSCSCAKSRKERLDGWGEYWDQQPLSLYLNLRWKKYLKPEEKTYIKKRTPLTIRALVGGA